GTLYRDIDQRRDLLERVQALRVVAQRALHARALAHRVGDRALQRAVLEQQVARGLLADPRRPGDAVRRVAAQRDEVRHELRRDAVALADVRRPELVGAALAAGEQDAHGVRDALEHVAV